MVQNVFNKKIFNETLLSPKTVKRRVSGKCSIGNEFFDVTACTFKFFKPLQNTNPQIRVTLYK